MFLRRTGDLQALLLSPACLDFALDSVKALLMPGLSFQVRFDFFFHSQIIS